ncbi:MAG: hypothetical protein RBT34_04725 [Anaerolineaceae bacterium]|nr:hypothetical protein [Anaerolineaceae bacterium]
MVALTGCSALESIPYSPSTSPEAWLTMQPYAEIQIASETILVVQPSTSAIVYLLGVVTILAGLYFFKIRGAEKSRVWWGIALLLWGVGALFAGSSYEAFSYQLKCAGWELCTWTHWLEVAYLIVSLGSVDAMMVAEAYACTIGKWRKWLIRFAWGSFSLYLLLVLVGSFVPVKFLISFEMLLLFAAPNVVIFLILNGRRYRQSRGRMDLALLGVWGWLIVTISAYFLYYVLGISETLWARGIWFTENDVLHIFLIIWMVYIAVVVAPAVKDESISSV